MLDRANLKPYQDRGVTFLKERKRALPNGRALWLDMGLGKTIITLTAVADLKESGELAKHGPALLVGTIRIIYSVWRQEARKWKHTRKLRFSLVHGSMSERLRALRKPADIYLINYENLKWLESLTAIDKPNFGIFIADESSRLKAHNTKRFKALRRMVPEFDRRWLLTGTPAPNSLMNLWSQVYLMDEGERLGRSFALFRQRYFEASDWQGYTYEPRPGATRRIKQLVAPLVMRLDARDYVKMPKVMRNNINLDLPVELREMYDEMERRMFLELDKIDVEVFNAASLTTKCWQFANGALYGTGKENGEREWQSVHDLKLDALEEVLEESEGNPVLVPYWFRSDLARLKERLAPRFPKGVPHIGSGVRAGAADKVVEEWNKGKHQILLVHPISAAHGLNIQGGGHTLFFFSQTWSLELHDQMIARLARQGQQHQFVMVHFPVVRNTVDEAIQDSIRIKATNQRGLLDSLRRYRAAREMLS